MKMELYVTSSDCPAVMKWEAKFESWRKTAILFFHYFEFYFFTGNFEFTGTPSIPNCPGKQGSAVCPYFIQGEINKLKSQKLKVNMSLCTRTITVLAHDNVSYFAVLTY